MSKVEIYTTRFCPYCLRAKAILKAKGIDIIEYAVDGQPSLREQMISRANGGYTVPQIFINDKHIGGCDDMLALDKQDKLDLLLRGS